MKKICGFSSRDIYLRCCIRTYSKLRSVYPSQNNEVGNLTMVLKFFVAYFFFYSLSKYYKVIQISSLEKFYLYSVGLAENNVNLIETFYPNQYILCYLGAFNAKLHFEL